MIIRVGLFLGLVFHKLLWELMKTKNEGVTTSKQSLGLARRAVKWGKGGVLALLLVQTLALDILPIKRQRTPWTVIGPVLYVLGLALAVIGRLQLGRNWANLEDCQTLPRQTLVRHGVYAYLRHPIYVGDLLLLTGLQLALNSWLVLGVIIPLLVVVRQALAEERLLSRTFKEYREYCKQTKRFIPFVV